MNIIERISTEKIYVASDGTEFIDEKKCITHERRITFINYDSSVLPEKLTPENAQIFIHHYLKGYFADPIYHMNLMFDESNLSEPVKFFLEKIITNYTKTNHGHHIRLIDLYKFLFVKCKLTKKDILDVDIKYMVMCFNHAINEYNTECVDTMLAAGFELGDMLSLGLRGKENNRLDADVLTCFLLDPDLTNKDFSKGRSVWVRYILDKDPEYRCKLNIINKHTGNSEIYLLNYDFLVMQEKYLHGESMVEQYAGAKFKKANSGRILGNLGLMHETLVELRKHLIFDFNLERFEICCEIMDPIFKEIHCLAEFNFKSDRFDSVKAAPRVIMHIKPLPGGKTYYLPDLNLPQVLEYINLKEYKEPVKLATKIYSYYTRNTAVEKINKQIKEYEQAIDKLKAQKNSICVK